MQFWFVMWQSTRWKSCFVPGKQVGNCIIFLIIASFFSFACSDPLLFVFPLLDVLCYVICIFFSWLIKRITSLCFPFLSPVCSLLYFKLLVRPNLLTTSSANLWLKFSLDSFAILEVCGSYIHLTMLVCW